MQPNVKTQISLCRRLAFSGRQTCPWTSIKQPKKKETEEKEEEEEENKEEEIEEN